MNYLFIKFNCKENKRFGININLFDIINYIYKSEFVC